MWGGEQSSENSKWTDSSWTESIIGQCVQDFEHKIVYFYCLNLKTGETEPSMLDDI